ncbi:MAG: hypothetical protein FJY66_03445 [Calditrichaeota bacterium]|nr:hypothetical protein [Calditrichota bacterium]
MKTWLILVTFTVLLVSLSGISRAQSHNNDTCRVAWSEAWAWGNALAVKTHFERLYAPHASALLAADEEFRAGTGPKEIVDILQRLPGIEGVLFCGAGGETVQSPEGLVDGKTFGEFIFNRSEATSQARSAMMQRIMGGQIRFIRAELAGKSLDLMVRYVRTEEAQPPSAAICLLLDMEWLLARIPSEMDSLAHENAQLLFWVASPTNRTQEQSLGIIHGSDTLWWLGRKNIKVTNRQALWPLPEIEVHSWIHPLEAK